MTPIRTEYGLRLDSGADAGGSRMTWARDWYMQELTRRLIAADIGRWNAASGSTGRRVVEIAADVALALWATPLEPECPHCGKCPPPHHDFCGSDTPHGEHPMENGRACCGRTTL